MIVVVIEKIDHDSDYDHDCERQIMIMFGHEKLDVYRLSLSYVTFVYHWSKRLKGYHRHARDQLIRASQSVPLNIAEGNGKTMPRDRRKFFEIARGSALECAAIQDILKIGGMLSHEESLEAKQVLHRIVSMLTRMIQIEQQKAQS